MDKVIVRVGQWVHCSLYGGRDGVVVAIDGEQSPETVGSLGGIISHGGRANFDVIFEDGHFSRSLPESIVRGVQWRIYTDRPLADENKINNLYRAHDEKVAREKKEAEEKAEKFKRDVETLKKDPAYSHLDHVNSKYDDKETAKNIRKHLKHFYPGIKFSVKTKRGVSAIHVTIKSEGTTYQDVKAELSKFKAGRFDGYDDCYVSNYTPFHELFGSVDYLSVYEDI